MAEGSCEPKPGGQQGRPRAKRNYWRRSFGVLLCLTPCWLIAVSLGCRAFRLNSAGPSHLSASLGLTGAAVALGALNSYLVFIRPRRFKHKPDYRNISAYPALGTILVTAGLFFGFSNVPVGILSILAVLLDTGGLPWFLVWTWRDSSFWDE